MKAAFSIKRSSKLVLAALAAGLAAAAAAQGSAPDLAVYAGKSPLVRVGGITFLSHPTVRTAVPNASPSSAIAKQILSSKASPAPVAVSPLFVLGSGCDPLNCENNNWSILISRSTPAHTICYKAGGEPARWYRRGRLIATAGLRCGWDFADVPDIVLALR